MRVTTNSIITTSPSTLVPTLKSMSPFCHHVIACTTGCTTGSASCAGPANSPRPNARRPSLWPVALSTRSIHWKAATTDRTNAVPTAPMPISAPRSGIRFPKKRIRRNETAGSAGMIQA